MSRCSDGAATAWRHQATPPCAPATALGGPGSDPAGAEETKCIMRGAAMKEL